MLFPNLKEYTDGMRDKQMVASDAGNILNNEAFKIAIQSLQEGILRKIVYSKPKEVAEREELKKMFDLTFEVEAELKVLISNVKIDHEKEKLKQENNDGRNIESNGGSY